MNWTDNIYAGGGGLLCTTANYSSSAHGSMSDPDVIENVKSDAAFQHEMQLALKHFMYTFASSNAMNGVSPDSEIVRVSTWWQNAFTAANIAFGALTVLSFAGCIMAGRKRENAQ